VSSYTSCPFSNKLFSLVVETGEKYICRFKANSLASAYESLNDQAKAVFSATVKQYEFNADSETNPSAAFHEMMKSLSQNIYSVRQLTSDLVMITLHSRL